MRLIAAPGLIARIPPAAAGAWAALASPVASTLAPGRARAWEANLRAIGPDLHASRPSARRVAYHHLMMLYESFALLGGRRFDIRSRGDEHLDGALARGRGVILVSAHVGNWNLGAHQVAERSGRPVHSVAGVQLARGLTAPLRLAMRRIGIRVHPRRGAVARFTRILRAGGIVALQLDGDQHAESGLATRGIRLLARRTGAAVLPAVCVRDGQGRFTLEFHPLVMGEPIASSAGVFERILRDLIGERPEQWALFRPLWEGV